MSIIDPKIDVLLDATDNDRFLLCSLASKRAHDINAFHGFFRNCPRRGLLRPRDHRYFSALSTACECVLLKARF